MQESDLKKYKLILASGSARRKEIFEKHGLTPIVMPMDVDETLPADIAPQDAVMYLALKKGLAAEEALSDDSSAEKALSDDSMAEEALLDERPALIISADTIVYAKDITTDRWTIMGKPKDEDDAWRMLRSIAAVRHKVMTGVAIIHVEKDLPALKRVFYDSTDVFVDPLTDEQLKAYIDSGEPFGKAGGYAIQLEFGKYIDHIDGDFENVVGFPYNHMIKELETL